MSQHYIKQLILIIMFISSCYLLCLGDLVIYTHICDLSIVIVSWIVGVYCYDENNEVFLSLRS
jgi:hypothetical protein